MLHGDTGAALRHHDSLCRFFDHVEALYNSTGAGHFAEGNMYGDWVVPPPATMGNKSLIAMYAMLNDLRMGQTFFAGSPAAGAAARARRCAWLFARAATDFHDAFFDEERGMYGSGLQTEQALPLFLGIVPEHLRQGVIKVAVDDIVHAHDMHTTSGIIGIKAMLEVLTDAGRSDVALAMLQQDSYPSLGYMLKGGAAGYEPATTLWELWDADVQGPSMNSRNHIMFGSVVGWMYKQLIGIRPLEPGFALAAIAPSGVGVRNLTSAEGRVATPHGDIVVEWSLLPLGPTCASGVAEGDVAVLRCNAPGDVISSVAFASFGTPTGGCAGNGTGAFSKSACDANRTTAIVRQLCVGKPSCTLQPEAVVYGEPCHGAKHLDVAVVCKLPSLPTGSRVLQLAVTLPVDVDARVSLPLGWGRLAAATRVAEGGAMVWDDGRFLPGVSGITSAKASADGEVIELAVASGGTYQFVVS